MVEYGISYRIYVTGQVCGPHELQNERYEFLAEVHGFRKKTAGEKGGADSLHFDGNLEDEYKQFLTDEIREYVLGFILHESAKIKETTSLPFGHENKITKDMILSGNDKYLGMGIVQVNYIGESKELPELPDFNFEVIEDKVPIDGRKQQSNDS